MITSHGKAVALGSPAALVLEYAGHEALEVYGPPAHAWIAGFGWACFGISVAGYSKSFENYVASAVLTPLFLGSFFPLDEFPRWA